MPYTFIELYWCFLWKGQFFPDRHYRKSWILFSVACPVLGVCMAIPLFQSLFPRSPQKCWIGALLRTLLTCWKKTRKVEGAGFCQVKNVPIWQEHTTIDTSVLCIYILLRSWRTVVLRSWQKLLPRITPLNLREFLHLFQASCSVWRGLSHSELVCSVCRCDESACCNCSTDFA